MPKHNVFHYCLTVCWVLIKSFLFVIFWSVVTLLGWGIFQNVQSPFNIALGLPLVLIGGGFIIHSLWTVLLAIFSLVYNKGVCFLCHDGD